MIVTAVIPARIGSTRLHRKILAEINGHTMLWHVWSKVIQGRKIDRVYVATDSEEVYMAVQSWGGEACLTSPTCRSGTERVASILERLDADLILNVQGDEPLVEPSMLDSLVDRWMVDRPAIVTPVFQINSLEELQNPNIVKVARRADGGALYFSRQPIPYVRDVPVIHWLESRNFWGHVGVYAYSRKILTTYSELPESELETAEKLEQLRFLDAGYSIQTVETSYRPNAVDTAEDLERVRNLLLDGRV